MDAGRNFSFIAIGTELLKGVSGDANGPWLARFLSERGHTLVSLEVCPDDPERVCEALATATGRSFFTIVSGGLGPTPDDLTREILARYRGVELVEDERARHLAEEPSYHLVPEGFEPLANPVGKAPGLLGQGEGGSIVALPGVPLEFQEMFTREVYPLLVPEPSSFQWEQLTIRTWGVKESDLFSENPRLWDELSERGRVSCLPHPLMVDLVVQLWGSEGERERKRREVLELLRSSTVGDRVWQVGSLGLLEYVQKKLREQSFSLGFCESCTGGLASHSLTNLPGSSKIFKGSVVCYSNQVKRDVLGVPEEILQQRGAVSKEVAQALALGGKRVLGVDYCLSYTGIAGPEGGSLEKPVGTVVIGLATPKGCLRERFFFSGNREQLKVKFFKRGLFLLLGELEKKS